MRDKTKALIMLSVIIILAIFLDFIPLYKEYESMVTYVIKPLIWVGIFIFTLTMYKDDYIRNTKYEKDVLTYVFIATIVYFMMYFFVGFIQDFALNPYNRSLGGFILNFWTFGSVIIAKEYLRYFFVNNCNKKHIYLYGILISILFAFSEINKLNFSTNFTSFNNIVKFLIEGVMAEMFISLFLTYICYYASYKAVLVYRLIPLVLTLTLSILPNINWMLHSLVKAIVPFFAYLFINNEILKIDNKKEEQKNYKYGFKFWGVSVCFLAVMVSFGIGLLPFYPVVIATGSMEPGINVGDIVIIKKEKRENIKIDDIIEYKVENYTVVHRVIAFTDDDELITKGDNNSSIDAFAIKDEQINGIVKARIPYLGYPTLFINSLFGNNLEDEVIVETGNN